MGALFLGKSRPQDSVTLSTSEVEYMTSSLCGQEIVYILAILRDFGLSQYQLTLVYEDSLARTSISIKPVLSKYSRHIDIRKHYLRELCLAGIVKTDSITHSSYENLTR